MINLADYQHKYSEEELLNLRVFCDQELNCDDLELGKTLVNEMDYVGRRLTTNNSVPANIHRDKFLPFWRDELEAPPFVLDQIQKWLFAAFCCGSSTQHGEEQLECPEGHALCPPRGEAVGAARLH